jgi:hypothetical protein
MKSVGFDELQREVGRYRRDDRTAGQSDRQVNYKRNKVRRNIQ